MLPTSMTRYRSDSGATRAWKIHELHMSKVRHQRRLGPRREENYGGGLLNNNNNNSHDNVYGAVIMTQSHCESSPGSSDEYRLSAGWPPTLRPSQSTWAVSPPKIGSFHPHPPSPHPLVYEPTTVYLSNFAPSVVHFSSALVHLVKNLSPFGHFRLLHTATMTSGFHFLVFYCNHSQKMHRSELRAWDRQSDRRADRSIAECPHGAGTL